MLAVTSASTRGKARANTIVVAGCAQLVLSIPESARRPQ